jgi:uncharacterized DUF497 family protein
MVEYNDAAFKHGITREQIDHAMMTSVYEGPAEENSDRYIVIGFDSNRTLLEIMYNFTDEDGIYVFHAMKCRKSNFKMINRKVIE